jgi:hypothetical protein
MRIALSAVVSTVSLLVAACAQQAPGPKASAATRPESVASSAPAVDGHLCEVKTWQYDDVAAACKPGQKIVFLPESFGNEQLPVIFAAVNCDLRYSVALTTGAVTCIYHPIVPKPATPAAQSKS